MRRCIRRSIESVENVVSGFFFILPDLDVPFFGHATAIEYARRMREILRTDTSSESNVVVLFCYCLPRAFSPLNPIRDVGTEVETWTWKCSRCQRSCSSAGKISNCLWYHQKGEGLCMGDRQRFGMFWIVLAGFMWLHHSVSLTLGVTDQK